MPISNKDLGKYKKPGIYIEEKNQSAISLPIQDVMINLVPGFSKRGPFNKPVRVEDPNVFETIFGSLDKNLENKGSFFHRTVEEMLQKGPVYALSLLKTDPNRDLLEWQSFSVAAQYDNGPKNTAPYERFFNRQDFWERDPESFMDIVNEEYDTNPYDKKLNPTGQPNPSEVLMHLTNMGEKRFTVFSFKSSITGFDVSAEAYYGGLEKVPSYINPKDYISDYMITVMAISGDWTNYASLSADNYWGKYFDANGLIKSTIQNFVNDTFTNLVCYYDVCLIPNFKDYNGRDMYVKNVINAETDKTGLFCYYNEEALLNSDSYNGTVDVIGQTMVCDETSLTEECKKTINFLSYQANLSDKTDYLEKILDQPSNVFGNKTLMNATGETRGLTNTNWYTELHPSSAVVTEISKLIILISGTTITAPSGFTVGDVVYFSKSFGVVDNTTPYYITSTGSAYTISTEKGGVALSLTAPQSYNGLFLYRLKEVFTDSSFNYNLNGVVYTLSGVNTYFDPFVITNSGVSYARTDVVYLSTDNTQAWTLKGTQVSGIAPNDPNFMLNNNNTIILGKVIIEYLTGATPSFTLTWSGVTVDSAGYLLLPLVFTSGTTTSGKYLDITFDGTLGSTVYNNYLKLRSQKVFTEVYTNLSANKGVIINLTNDYKYEVLSPIVYGATTNTNSRISISFNNDANVSEYYDSPNRIVKFYYIDNEFVMPSSNVTSIQTLSSPLGVVLETGVIGKQSALYLDYYNGNINNGDFIYFNNLIGNTKYFLHMYLDSNKGLTIKFSGSPIEETPEVTLLNWNTNYYDSTLGATVLRVWSDVSDYKQTLEIEAVGGTDDTTVNYFYIDNSRYSQITKGWFIEAYYDQAYYEVGGEGYLTGAFPRKLVRVTKVGTDTTNPDLKIVYVDGPIRILYNSGTTEKYTTAYMSIDNYVGSYKGLSFKPFTVHPDSIPNGTEERLSSILSVIDKETNLAKGLMNKNKISWRYLVDSFGLGLTENSKQELADICGGKLNCFGFINMPSVRNFKTSLNPSFTNPDRTINISYVAQGGNPDANPDFLYSFAEGVGQSCVGYFFPYIKDVNDTSKFVPPSAKVAKAYMAKFTGELSNSYPWTIVAGPLLSLMTEINTTEMSFSDDDLEDLFAMGANPIVYSLNRGYNINSESTAQVFPISSLSYIHSREVLIELENRLYDMLLNYHWRFNTPEIRAEIKFRADLICKELLNANALYDFKNVCDKTNNTDYLIDLQMGVLDTYIEIIKGMGIIVNNITILKKGTIQSGGFIAA